VEDYRFGEIIIEDSYNRGIGLPVLCLISFASNYTHAIVLEFMEEGKLSFDT
jgi:hypothetical protein